jgi:hypothetical protein
MAESGMGSFRPSSATPGAPKSQGPARDSSSPKSPPRALHANASSGDRSCVPCHRRKVRCDKQMPCSACTRGRLACTYPSPCRHPIRRPRKTTMADVASRISDLEKSIAAVKHQPESPFTHTPPSPGLRVPMPASSNSASLTDGYPAHKADDFLLRNGSATQYFNESLLSRVIEQVSRPSEACAKLISKIIFFPD